MITTINAGTNIMARLSRDFEFNIPLYSIEKYVAAIRMDAMIG